MKKWTRGSKTTQKSDCQCMTAYQAGLSVPDSFNFPDDGFYQIGSVCEDCPPNANCSSRDDALGLSVGQIFAKTGAWRAFWNDTIFLNCKSGYSGVSAEKIAENRCCPNATKCSQINTELNQTARAVFMDDQEEREWQTQWRNKQCLCTTDECYSGPMCMVCGGLRGDAYVLDPLSKKCKACNHGKPNMFYALAGLALVSSVIFLVVTVIIFHTHIGANEAAGKGMDDYEEEKAREEADDGAASGTQGDGSPAALAPPTDVAQPNEPPEVLMEPTAAAAGSGGEEKAQESDEDGPIEEYKPTAAAAAADNEDDDDLLE